jgi:hypothetical protein
MFEKKTNVESNRLLHYRIKNVQLEDREGDGRAILR